MSTRKILNSSLIGISLLLLWVFHEQLASMMHWFSDPKAVTEAIQRSGFWGPVILFVLFILQVFIAFIPGQALMVASGYIYGFTDGMLITWLSLVLGGQAAFWLARRYGRQGGRLLEIGSGLGHLVGQLEDTFETYGIDVNRWAVNKSKEVVRKTQLETASAQELPFSDNHGRKPGSVYINW